MDAKLKKGEWDDASEAEGEQKIQELFDLVQLDIWASIATVLSLPTPALPDKGRVELVQYVEEEQEEYSKFAQQGAKILIRQDREFEEGGHDAVTRVCTEIERAIKVQMDGWLGSVTDVDKGVQLRESRQQTGSILKLYQRAAQVKEFFDEVTFLFS